MTTTVCDLLNKIIVADTRWSCGSDGSLTLSDGQKYFVYCDETGFNKISIIGKSALVVAGYGPLISEWKRWWAISPDFHSKPPAEIDGRNQVNLAIIDLDRNEVIFDAGVKSVLFCMSSQEIKAFTSGSSRYHAASHLQLSGCAKQAVMHASELDCCTSPSVGMRAIEPTRQISKMTKLTITLLQRR